jgi:carboxypeptidase Taq
MVAGFKSEWWPRSNRNAWPRCVGIRTWRAKIWEYLGVDVPNDAIGALQDFHWSAAQIGNFSNYTAGNVMAGQLFETASKDAVIAKGLDEGDYSPLRAFLRETVHRHGRRYSRDELLVRATGRKLDPEPYIAYLTAKYTELYNLSARAPQVAR